MRCIWCARRCSSPATKSSCRTRRGRRARATSSRARPAGGGARCTRALGWRFELDELESRITPATRAIYVNSPHNPTGGVLTRADLERIAALARERKLWVISDEAYEDVVFDGAQHVSPASLPDMYERTISIYTFSKTYAMTGLRLGYLATTRCRASRAHQESAVLHLQQRHVDRAVRRHRRARGIAGRIVEEFRAELRLGATCSMPASATHAGGLLQRRAAARRVLRVPEDRSGLASAARGARVAVLGAWPSTSSRAAGSAACRCRLRRARRGLRPLLLRARSRASSPARWTRWAGCSVNGPSADAAAASSPRLFSFCRSGLSESLEVPAAVDADGLAGHEVRCRSGTSPPTRSPPPRPSGRAASRPRPPVSSSSVVPAARGSVRARSR